MPLAARYPTRFRTLRRQPDTVPVPAHFCMNAEAIDMFSMKQICQYVFGSTWKHGNTVD